MMLERSGAPGILTRAQWALAAAAALLPIVAYLYAPYADHGPPLCVLRMLTGVPCPGCGLTRATCALVHGDVAAAVRLHAGSVLILALAVAYLLVFAHAMAGGRLLASLSARVREQSAGAAVVALLAYHAIRLATWWADGSLHDVYWAPSLPGRLLSALSSWH